MDFNKEAVEAVANEKDVPNPKTERDAQQSTKPSKPHPMGTAS